MDTTPPSGAQAAIDAFQDSIISQRLPLWLRQTPPGQLSEVGKALANSLRSLSKSMRCCGVSKVSTALLRRAWRRPLTRVSDLAATRAR